MERKQTKILALAVVMCIASVVMMCLALVQPQETVGTFTPPPFEAGAQTGVPEVPAELGWSEVDAKVYTAKVCGVVAPADGAADVWLWNPETNDVWLKLRVLDAGGEILAETGLLKPGEYVQTVTFDRTPRPGDKISLKIMAYEPNTYYSAGSVMLNTTVSEGGAQ